jgi:hypothetical protein
MPDRRAARSGTASGFTVSGPRRSPRRWRSPRAAARRRTCSAITDAATGGSRGAAHRTREAVRGRAHLPRPALCGRGIPAADAQVEGEARRPARARQPRARAVARGTARCGVRAHVGERGARGTSRWRSPHSRRSIGGDDVDWVFGFVPASDRPRSARSRLVTRRGSGRRSRGRCGRPAPLLVTRGGRKRGAAVRAAALRDPAATVGAAGCPQA